MLLTALRLACYILMTTASSLALAQLERVDASVEVPSLSVEQLANGVDEGTVSMVIDVRLEEDFNAEPVLIPDATWKNPHEIEDWAKELRGNERVVVYCVAGRWVSQSVTKKLQDMGIDVAQLDGGIEAWKASEKPTQPATKR